MKQPSFVLVWTLASVFGASGALVAQEPAAPRTVRARAAEAPKAAPQDPAASVRRELRKILAEVDQQDLSPEEKQLVRQAIERAAKKVAEANAKPPAPLLLAQRVTPAAEPPAPPAPPVEPMVVQKLPKGAIIVQEVEGKPMMVQLEGKEGNLRIVSPPGSKATDFEVRTYTDKPVVVVEGQPIDTKAKPRTFTVVRQAKDGAEVDVEALKALEGQRQEAVERALQVAKESQDLQREIAVVRERAKVVRAKAEAERAKVEADRAAKRGGDGNQELRAMIEQMRAEMQELRQMVREMQKQPQPNERRRQAAVVERAKIEGGLIAPARLEEVVVEQPEVEIAETVELVEVEAPKVEARTVAPRRSGR